MYRLYKCEYNFKCLMMDFNTLVEAYEALNIIQQANPENYYFVEEVD